MWRNKSEGDHFMLLQIPPVDIVVVIVVVVNVVVVALFDVTDHIEVMLSIPVV